MKYKEYINSSKWKLKRKLLFEKIGYECEQCGYVYNLHVHHKTYDNLGNEPLEDLQVLCKQCHLSKHDKYFDKLVLKKGKKSDKLPNFKEKCDMLKTKHGRKKLRKLGYRF